MDQWEVLIEGYQTPPELRAFHKVLQTARVMLKEDLAAFEIDWLTQTLVYEPVSLLETILSKRSDEAWSRPIGDAFKLLSDVVTQYGKRVEQSFEDIVKICLLSYDAQARVHAVHCLTSVVKLSPVGAMDARRHIVSMDEASTCKAPLAILLGTICEYYPEVVVEDATAIWRIYLNLLDSNKNSDTVTNAIFQGISGLLKHFGDDLPTAEMNLLYGKMAAALNISKCFDAVLSILRHHAGLFKEILSDDVILRRRLWTALSDPSVAPALLSVYTHLSTVVDKEKLQHIVTTEVLPCIETSKTVAKYTALRILTQAQRKYGVCLGVTSNTDVYTLEFQLRCGSVSYDTAEAVSLCIEYNFPNSDKLLQTAIVFYDNLPTSKRKGIVVAGILNAPPELRTTIITYLITESCHQETSLSAHLPLWRDVLSENAPSVFEIFIEYLQFTMGALLNESQYEQTLPERFVNLLKLTSHVLTLQSPENNTNDQCMIVLPLLADLSNQYGPNTGFISVIRGLEYHVQEKHYLLEAFKNIRLDRCRDEAVLCESCLALIQAPDGVHVGDILTALRFIFSRNDAEPKTLSLALRKLETLMIRNDDELDRRGVANVISLVEMIRSRKDLVGKDARVLHRDIVIFLGKYSYLSNINITEGDIFIVKLKDMLILNIPNPNEGINYKINLQRMLQLALVHEDPHALHTLLIIICANLSSNRNSTLQYALARVSHALCRAAARGSLSASLIQQSMLYCDADAAHGILQHIKEERSPGVRKMLSDTLQGLLLRDPGSEVTEDLVKTVAEHATLMMSSDDALTKMAGLDVTESLIIVLKENNLLTRNLLPNILILISKTNELDSNVTFEIASALFVEKIELFSARVLDNTIVKLLELILLGDVLDAKIYRKAVTMTLEFTKKIFEYKKESHPKVVNMTFDVMKQDGVDIGKCLQTLAVMRCVFGFNSDICRYVLSDKENSVLDMAFNPVIPRGDIGYFKLEAILNFFKEYADILLELQYQKTLQYLGGIITKLTPLSVKYIYRTLSACLSKYKQILKKIPQIILSRLETWCEGLPVKEITDNIEKNNFLSVHTLPAHSLRIMLDMFDIDFPVTLTAVSVHVKKWPRVILKLYSTGSNYIKTEMSFLTDLLSVALKFLTVTDVKKLISEGHGLKGASNGRVGLEFCRVFMSVFFKYLLAKPFLLLHGDMRSCCSIINDIIRWFIKNKCPEELSHDVLELVDELWPTYESVTDFDQKHSLLVDLTCLPRKLGRESNPMRWVVNVISSQGASREDMMRLVGVLPGGEEFSGSYRLFASILPTRVSELDGVLHAALRALFDALSAHGDPTLLDIVITLAGGDDTKGWWDEAMESSMASLALKADYNICTAVYTRCWEGLSMGVCERLLMPLLRYSSPSFCEQFLSKILKELLSTLRRGYKVSNHSAYHKSVVDYTRALKILQIAFEKIPPAYIESPNSILYGCIDTQRTWHLVKEVGTLCYTLRDGVKCPEGADSSIKVSCRLFQCACYNSISSAICMRRPNANMYEKTVFNKYAWSNIIEHEAVYKLPLRTNWAQTTNRHAVSIAVPSTSDVTSCASSVRTRIFLRTLSENPLQYDLINDETQETMGSQELELTDSELNSHECAATLTAVLAHASTLDHVQWRDTLSHALTGDLHRNIKWLLAQAVCNCKDELKPHASALRPALFAVVSDTAVVENGKTILNGLHIDIIGTLVHWGSGDTPPSDSMVTHLNSTMGSLIATCIENRKNQHTHRSLLDCISKLLDAYGEKLQISWAVFVPYLEDKNDAMKSCFSILQRVTKSKIIIPELLPTLVANFEGKHWHQLSKMAELFGLALAACTDKALMGDVLMKYRAVLNRVRKNAVSDYVKMLYYAQVNFAECCDDYNFRIITDLTSKLSSAEKSKCLQIISCHVSLKQRTDTITNMFEVLDISELLVGDEAVSAMGVVRVGLGLMDDQLKRRVVNIISGYCDNSLVKVRRAALEVIVKGFEELFTTHQSEPSTKKFKSELSPVLQSIEYTDVFTTCILHRSGCGVVDCDENVAKYVRNTVGGLLSADMGVRFAECFYITVYLPIVLSTNKNKTYSLSVCVTALLEMLFSDLRAQEKFKKIRLREEPLNTETGKQGPSNLLSMPRTYQGTLRSHAYNTNIQKKNNVKDALTPGIDAQVPIENILDTLINFSKITPESSQALLGEVMEAARGAGGRGFDLAAAMSRQLAAILATGVNDLTPLVLEACRVFIDGVSKVDGLHESLEKLRGSTLGTEAESLIKTLHEDVLLRRAGNEDIVLGTPEVDEDDCDVTMHVPAHPFSLEELASSFGKLSNWDELTIRERNRIEQNLPQLWTDKDTFKISLDNYTGTDGWFGKMVLCYRGGSKQDSMRWVREIDRWPHGHFAVSAITEAIDWQYDTDSIKHTDIQTRDCLAEWAARLMLRSLYQKRMSESEEPADNLMSRSHELVWCESASERSLPALVLDCVKRNSIDLYVEETLPWLRQKVLALRAIGLKRNDRNSLRKALEIAEKYTPLFTDQSKSDVILSMNKLILDLNNDVKSLSMSKVNALLRDVHVRFKTKGLISHKNRQVLNSIYESAMIYYDELWLEDDVSSQSVSFINMSEVLGKAIDHGIKRYDVFVSMILNRLGDCQKMVSQDAASVILNRAMSGPIDHTTTQSNMLIITNDVFQLIIQDLDQFSIDQLKRSLCLFPGDVINAYSVMVARLNKEEQAMDTMKECFQLICDTDYTLLQYCSQLEQALKIDDAPKWDAVFKTMKRKMFGNPHAGSDYHLLNKYKNKLFEIEHYGNIEMSRKRETLKDLAGELKWKRPQKTLRLSQLCPLLCAGDFSVDHQDCLRRLLSLPPSVRVIRFDEQVSVYTDSVQRPCVVRCVLSDGAARRFLHKSAGTLAADAAAVRAAAAAARAAAAAAALWGGRPQFVTYKVTPLSEDCGLIEFLEDHVRIRDMIPKANDINLARPSNYELILSPTQASVTLHKQFCSMTPSYALRSAIEANSTCVQDFITKKRRFLETLSTMTVLNWIFGLGDRHLENILYSIQNGGVCCIDWAAMFKYGGGELPPARLTRNILSVCDVIVLEASLQNLLGILRRSYKVLLPVIISSFSWMGREFTDKLPYIKDILQGRSLSYDVTRHVLEHTDSLMYKDKYIQLLDDIFKEYNKKELYSIEEQISCLLQHCTDARVLSVTRREWEPWL